MCVAVMTVTPYLSIIMNTRDLYIHASTVRDSSLVETCCVKYTEGLFHYTDLGLDNAA